MDLKNQKNEMTRVSFVVSQDLKNKIQNYAKSRGMSFSSYARSILIKDMENFENEKGRKML